MAALALLASLTLASLGLVTLTLASPGHASPVLASPVHASPADGGSGPADRPGHADRLDRPADRIVVVADAGPASDSLVERIREEIDALFAARRDVSVSVRAVGAPLPADDGVLVAVGPGAVAQVCRAGSGQQRDASRETEGAGQAEDAGQSPVIAVSTGSGVLVPPSTPGCAVVGPRGWPSDVFRAFHRLAQFDRVDVVVDRRVAASVPDAEARLNAVAQAAGVDARLVPLQAGATLDAGGAEGGRRAVFLDHLDRWSAGDVRALTRSATGASLPVFAYDPAHVEHHGALAAPDRIDRIRARRVALAVESRLTDTPPAAQAQGDALDDAQGDARTEARADVRDDAREEVRDDARDDASAEAPPLVVDPSVAEAQGIAIPLALRVDARFVEAAPPTDALTLAGSMRASIRENLRLQAERQRTSAAANNVDQARAQLLPQVNASATGRLVNEDLASASLGSQPEELMTSAVTLRQVVFSEPAFARLSVERRMQAMREFERQSVRLDAARDAARAYLGVLQADAAVKIQRENVRVVRANLEAARARRQAGEADPREVSRLQTQRARAEQGLLRAIGRRRTARIGFNRVLNRPLDAEVALDRRTGVDPRPVLASFPYRAALTDPNAAASFRMFWVHEARTRAPEVRAVNRLVGARERQWTSSKRAFWMPEIALEGSISDRVYEGGAGASGLGTLPGSGGFSIPTPPDRQWTVGVTASFPLFDGLQRAARQRQASDRLAEAKTRRMIAELGVEQQVRTALVDLETSHEAVQRALRAADAAQRTLDVTQAAYRQGTASLVDLIDAQTTALTTRQEASDAAYGLIRDWVDVQRAGGSFRVLRTPQEQADFQARLDDFVPDDVVPNTAAPNDSMPDPNR